MIPDGKTNHAFKMTLRKKLLILFFCFAGGTLYSASLPPFNLGFAVVFAFIPIFYAASCFSWRFTALCGWCWGMGWSLFAYQFLREISAPIPYLLAPVLALWPALWAALLPWCRTNALLPPESAAWTALRKTTYIRTKSKWYNLLLYALMSALLYTLIEWSRSRLFCWNDLSVTLWKFPLFIQIADLGGCYMITFLIIFTASCLPLFFISPRSSLPTFACALLMIIATLVYGYCRISAEAAAKPPITFKAGLVQCDLSQRRRASYEQSIEAVDVCIDLSSKVAAEDPDLIIWPESSVPIPLRSNSPAGSYYRSYLAGFLSRNPATMLIGSLDFRLNGKETELTNSALLIRPNGTMAGKYDKIHRVPFGEYVPFRTMLPEKLIRMIDMGRDLAPGNDSEPLQITPQVKAGTAICYEGVFSYITRETARRGANLLVVISNDAWYPRSSEPEQHLANAVMRAVETGLPMIRCGNNGGSGVVTPTGIFIDYIGSKHQTPELLRERAAGVVTVQLHPATPGGRTFFVRHGEWFILLSAAAALAGTIFLWLRGFRKKAAISQLIRKSRKI